VASAAAAALAMGFREVPIDESVLKRGLGAVEDPLGAGQATPMGVEPVVDGGELREDVVERGLQLRRRGLRIVVGAGHGRRCAAAGI